MAGKEEVAGKEGLGGKEGVGGKEGGRVLVLSYITQICLTSLKYTV